MNIIKFFMICSLLFVVSLSSFASVKPIIVFSEQVDYAKNVARAFTQKTGVPVIVMKIQGSGDAIVRLEGEQKLITADVWFGGGVGAHGQAYEQGLIEPYKSKLSEQLIPAFRDPLGGYITNGLYVGILGFGVNKKVLRRRNSDLPETWNDLLKGELRALVGMKNPMLSGTAYTTIATLIALKGEEAAFNYIKKLNDNIWEYTIGQSERVRRGDIGVAITYLHEFSGANRKPAVEFIFPKDGTSYEVGGISLVKASKQKELAKRFIDFALSHEGQMLKYFSNWQLSTNKATAKLKREYQDLPKLVPLDFSYFGKNRARLVAKWHQTVFKN